MSDQSPTTIWRASTFLSKPDPSSPSPDAPYALIILNQPLEPLKHIFPQVWEHASIRLCADGGANRLYDVYQGTYVPDVIRGDLDSLRDDVAEFFKSKGTAIEKVDDQDSTDLMKCIQYVRSTEEFSSTHTLLVLSAIGGRLDQTLSSIHYLHVLALDPRYSSPPCKVFLVSQGSVAFLLTAGKHSIHIDSNLEGPSCGIVPVGVAGAHLWTDGLRWELQGEWWSMGRLVSTSNLVAAEKVEVETDAAVLWTIELKEA